MVMLRQSCQESLLEEHKGIQGLSQKALHLGSIVLGELLDSSRIILRT